MVPNYLLMDNPLLTAAKQHNAPKSRGTLLKADLYSDLAGPQQNPVRLYDNVENKTTETVDPIDDGSKRKYETVSEGESTSKKNKLVDYVLKGYYAERKGERDEMQDMNVIDDDCGGCHRNLHESIHRLALYGVFDGHAGRRASKFASVHLPTNIQSFFPRGDVDFVQKHIKKCFIDAFKKTDDDFLREASKRKPTWKDGTTAVCVLVVNDVLYIANLGDSKAVLCRYSDEQQKCVTVPLSVDHSPSAYEERVRIQKAGGHVTEGRVMGVLEVSRSIGDGQYKNHGVICMPDVKRCQLTNNDRFIILACDGLWKTFTSQDSVDLVNKTLEELGENTSVDERYDAACARLVSKAVLRLSADNVTVVIVSLSKADACHSCK